MQSEAARRAGDPSHQSEDPPPEGLGGYGPFAQGINIRMVTDEVAAALASIEYRDDNFERRRLYTAWDNLGDEKRFFTGLERLNAAGIPSKHLMVYMLIGYRPGETMKDILYRFNRLREAGCKPYPMVFERWRQPELRRFARWAIRGTTRWSTGRTINLR